MQRRTRLVLAVVILALAGLIATLVLRGSPSAPVPVLPTAARASPDTEAATVPRDVESGRAQVSDPPTLVVPSLTTPSSADGEPARLVGRCLAAESGRPLAGARLECLRLGSADRTPLVAPFTTGGDGRFELRVGTGAALRLVARAPARSPRIAHLHALAPGATVDLGDVRLAAGFPVEGQVLGRDGAPVAGVTVVLSAVFVGIDVGEDVPASLSGDTDAFGAFRIDGDVPVGDFPLALVTPGWRLLSPARVRVDPLSGAAPVVAVAERLPSIAGHVVDEDGLPVAGVRLSLAGGLMPMPPVTTGADGAFELFARGADRTARGVMVQDPGPCEPPEEASPLFEWGTRDARIVLRRAVTVELEVVERESRAAVTEYAVACFRSDSVSIPERAPRHAGRHPDGRLLVARVRRGQNHLQVRPSSAELLDSDWVVFEAGQGRAPLRVELERMHRARVRVVTASGEPMAGSRVSLHRSEAHPPATDPLLVAGLPSGDGALFESAALLPQVASAVTDARGEVELPFPSDLSVCVLRVTGAEHLEVRERAPALGEAAVHEVIVARGARVEGRCVVRGYREGPLALQFVGDGDAPLHELLAPLAPDGAFRSPPLAPGELAIHLSVPGGANSGRRAALQPALQRVVLREGESLRLDLEARAWDAGSLIGSARVDGAAPASAQLLLQLELPGVSLPFGPHALDGAGGFVLDGLPPGRWSALLYVGEPEYLRASQPFHLAGGETREVQLEFASLYRVLRILGVDGRTPLAHRRIGLVAGGETHFATSDAQGRTHFPRSLDGEVEVVLEGTPHVVRVTLPQPGQAHALDVVLPLEP